MALSTGAGEVFIDSGVKLFTSLPDISFRSRKRLINEDLPTPKIKKFIITNFYLLIKSPRLQNDR